jgi:hypothetical protein
MIEFDEELIYAAFVDYRRQLPVVGMGGLVAGLILNPLSATDLLALIMLGAAGGIALIPVEDDFAVAKEYLGYPRCLEPTFYQRGDESEP